MPAREPRRNVHDERLSDVGSTATTTRPRIRVLGGRIEPLDLDMGLVMRDRVELFMRLIDGAVP